MKLDTFFVAGSWIINYNMIIDKLYGGRVMKKMKKLFVVFVLTLAITVETVEVPVQAAAKVYVAPNSGKKYHAYKGCRGLSRARRIVKYTKKKAKARGYKKCKICF